MSILKGDHIINFQFWIIIRNISKISIHWHKGEEYYVKNCTLLIYINKAPIKLFKDNDLTTREIENWKVFTLKSPFYFNWKWKFLLDLINHIFYLINMVN